jgi:hypothetical protein
VFLGLAAVGFVFTGCSEDPVSPSDQPSYIQANLIITNPLAPEPGQLTTLTLQAQGNAGSSAPLYRWFIEVGEFVDPDPGDNIPANEGISVLWQVPADTSGVFLIGAVASVTGSVDSIVRYVSIRHFESVDTGLRVSMYPNLRGGTENLFFIGSDTSPEDLDFIGYDAYRKNPTSGAARLTTCSECYSGDDFTFYGTGIIGSLIQRYFATFRQQLMNVWKFGLFFPSEDNISDDFSLGINQRRNQHRNPHASASINKVVWEKRLVGEAGDGTEDLFNVGFWNSSGTSMTLTTSLDSTRAVIGPDTVTLYRYFHNIQPMITADERYVLYFVDTTDTYEPCLVPFSGDRPDKAKRQALMTNPYSGIFGDAGISVDETTVFQWNPVADRNLCAFIDKGSRLCFFTADTLPLGSVTRLEDIGPVTEFVWSPGGDTCAVVTETGISLVSLGGSATEKFIKEINTDQLFGLCWAPDPDSNDPKLAFRMVRIGRGSEDSYSSVIIYSLNMDAWFYATPRVAWRAEPPVKYTWMRIVFSSDNTSFYAPIPVVSGRGVRLYYSTE